MPRPTLVVVSGPAGTGKTTLAHELAGAIGCPVICRDEIKEGMVRTVGPFEPTPGDELTKRTLPVFFDAIRLMLENDVSLVAEAAFQHHVWAPRLDALASIADIRIVQCHTDLDTMRIRVEERGNRGAHADDAWLREWPASVEGFQRLSLDAPSIDVDTTSGHEPPLDQIVEFLNV